MPLDRDEYSDTSLKNMEVLSSSSLAGVSNSAMRPTTKQEVGEGGGFVKKWRCMKNAEGTITEDQNQVTIDDGGNAVSDCANSAILEFRSYYLLDEVICGTVDRGCRFIKNQDSCLFK